MVIFKKKKGQHVLLTTFFKSCSKITKIQSQSGSCISTKVNANSNSIDGNLKIVSEKCEGGSWMVNLRLSRPIIGSPERKCKIGSLTYERISQFLAWELGVGKKQVVKDMPSNIVVPERRAGFGYLKLVQLRDDCR
jgi:hypothetical protein